MASARAKLARRRQRPRPGRIGPFLVAWLALAAVLFSVHGQRQALEVSVGDPSPRTYRAPTGVRVADPVATERRRDAARAQVPVVTGIDDDARDLMLATLPTAALPAPTLDVLLAAYRDPAGVRRDAIPALVDAAVAAAPEDARRDARLRLQQRLIPTARPDVAATEAARDAAAAAVEPVLRTLERDEVIIEAGSIVDEADLRALVAIGAYDPSNRRVLQALWVGLGALVVGGLLALPAAYGARALSERVGRRQYAFLVGVTLATIALQRVALEVAPDLFFVLLVPTLIAALIDEVPALLWAGWMAVVVALLVPGAPIAAAVAVLVSGLAAARIAGRVRTRLGLLTASVLGGAAGGGALLAVQAITSGALGWGPALTTLAATVGGGVLAGVLTLALLPLAEGVFEFLTEFRLVELASPQSPLLQRLVLQAPGTYQHSQIIANLVEQSVAQIGGNALLARVGALYHDVGKAKRPQFFVENQVGGDNPHDALSPHLSYLIITSHVRDGVEMLRESGLPPALEPFVTEHHGTTVLAYFYKRALEDSEGLAEVNFRYAGPKPRTKETAVLMLADAVESASRTLAEPSQSAIRAMIERLFEQRLQDEQLADSPLTFRDLDQISSTFERVLTASLHRRVTYPTADEIKGLQAGGTPATAGDVGTARTGGARGGPDRRDAPVPRT